VPHCQFVLGFFFLVFFFSAFMVVPLPMQAAVTGDGSSAPAKAAPASPADSVRSDPANVSTEDARSRAGSSEETLGGGAGGYSAKKKNVLFFSRHFEWQRGFFFGFFCFFVFFVIQDES
jgi:hypothetical protein